MRNKPKCISCVLAAMAGLCFVGGLAILTDKGGV